MKVLQHKRGDTFSRVCTWMPGGVAANLTGATILAQMRDKKTGDIVCVFNTTLANQGTYPGQFTMSMAPATAVYGTKLWEAKTYECDVQFTFPDTTVQSSATFQIQVIADVSR